ncbi:hypothetical protein BS47DRAFT_1402069 [Hydnum rufescens UP504]|uniref:Uncharacterized protein n=1 Tax=Hydnum rufescens UP504 TaxID=1448309 RepID=A0A9P6ADN1_9AGAM|nr:hypothetical protein BS47DRAFT_1402069 [Hydnum rufescens UP504]
MPRNSPARSHKPTSSLRSKGQTVDTAYHLQSTLATFDPIIVFGEVPKLCFTGGNPMAFTVATTSAPRTTPPLMLSRISRSSAAGMCSHYIRHFLAKIKAAKGRTPVTSATMSAFRSGCWNTQTLCGRTSVLHRSLNTSGLTSMTALSPDHHEINWLVSVPGDAELCRDVIWHQQSPE